MTALVTAHSVLFYVGGRKYETEQLHLQHTALKKVYGESHPRFQLHRPHTIQLQM
jgi:hypothetical protein